jgi:hypothetical protein
LSLPDDLLNTISQCNCSTQISISLKLLDDAVFPSHHIGPLSVYVPCSDISNPDSVAPVKKHRGGVRRVRFVKRGGSGGRGRTAEHDKVLCRLFHSPLMPMVFISLLALMSARACVHSSRCLRVTLSSTSEERLYVRRETKETSTRARRLSH